MPRLSTTCIAQPYSAPSSSRTLRSSSGVIRGVQLTRVSVRVGAGQRGGLRTRPEDEREDWSPRREPKYRRNTSVDYLRNQRRREQWTSSSLWSARPRSACLYVLRLELTYPVRRLRLPTNRYRPMHLRSREFARNRARQQAMRHGNSRNMALMATPMIWVLMPG